MDLEETEVRNDCADKGQQQFNRRPNLRQTISGSEAHGSLWWPAAARIQ
jgi:hypothetical protein